MSKYNYNELTEAEKEEMRADALNILNSPVVKFLFAELQEEYLQQLIQAEVGGLTAAHAHASMKGLAELQTRLELVETRNRPLRPRTSRNM